MQHFSIIPMILGRNKACAARVLARASIASISEILSATRSDLAPKAQIGLRRRYQSVLSGSDFTLRGIFCHCKFTLKSKQINLDFWERGGAEKEGGGSKVCIPN